ncbi:hypothetical protein RKF72_00005, partial [Klebsiella pneumoniae]|nr:hypothetical protein [Klebsiella pneumoniae]
LLASCWFVQVQANTINVLSTEYHAPSGLPPSDIPAQQQWYRFVLLKFSPADTTADLTRPTGLPVLRKRSMMNGTPHHRQPARLER